MPNNLPPEAIDKWEEVEAAHTPQEKLKKMQEFLSVVPQHKGTMKLRGTIKKRIAIIQKDLDHKKRMGTGKNISDPESCAFAQEVITNLLAFKQKIGRKYGKRLYPAVLGDREASERLAQLDVERYGVAKVKFCGTRDKPYYSTVKKIQLKPAEPLHVPAGMAEMTRTLGGINAGGSIDIFELGDSEFKADALLELTKQLVESGASEFFTYNRIVSYCENCHRNMPGTLHKCPNCGSMSTLTTFDRFTLT